MNMTQRINKEVQFFERTRRYFRQHEVQITHQDGFSSQRSPVPARLPSYVAELQADGLLTKGVRGRNGGAEMTATDRINLLLAAVLNHPRGVPLAEGVQCVRDFLSGYAYHAPHLSIEDNTRSAFQFVRSLSIGPLDNLGAALDGLLNDLLSGTFDRWAEGDVVSATVDFHANRVANMLIDRPQFGVSAAFSFGDVNKPSAPIEQIVRISFDALRRLATEETV